MSRHDDSLSLRQMSEHIEEAIASESTQMAHPEIPWREITGTRHHLVHGYDAVDFDILWNIATLDFPPLARQIKALLPEA